MTSPVHSTRGRPRLIETESSIRDAARSLLLEVGYDGLTLEAVASRAGVGRPTIYRRWNGKAALVADVLLNELDTNAPFSNKGDVRRTLAHQMRRVARSFSGTEGRWLTNLIVAAQCDGEVARLLRERFLLPRRANALDIIRMGMERGELRKDINPEVLVDALYAPFYHRLLMGHQPLDSRFVTTLLDVVLRGALICG